MENQHTKDRSQWGSDRMELMKELNECKEELAKAPGKNQKLWVRMTKVAELKQQHQQEKQAQNAKIAKLQNDLILLKGKFKQAGLRE